MVVVEVLEASVLVVLVEVLGTEAVVRGENEDLP
jgi:hypothetical protein